MKDQLRVIENNLLIDVVDGESGIDSDEPISVGVSTLSEITPAISVVHQPVRTTALFVDLVD